MEKYQNIINQKDILLTLARSKKKLRDSIISNSDSKLIQSICEIILNLLTGNLDINKETLKKLTKYKQAFRVLIQKGKLEEKKKILIQKGGFLQFLIPAVVTGISSIISSVISSHSNQNS